MRSLLPLRSCPPGCRSNLDLIRASAFVSSAAHYIGQSVTVEGLVTAVSTSKKGNTFINFGGVYPNQSLTGWVPAGTPLASDPSVMSLQGKRIRITGLIDLYRGKPEIRIMSKSQIQSKRLPVSLWKAARSQRSQTNSLVGRSSLAASRRPTVDWLTAVNSGGETARRSAAELVHHLGTRGHFEFRDFLPATENI